MASWNSYFDGNKKFGVRDQCMYEGKSLDKIILDIQKEEN